MALNVVPVAPEILVNVTLSVDDCHWQLPVDPVKVSVVLLVPVQTVAAPEMDPATG